MASVDTAGSPQSGSGGLVQRIRGWNRQAFFARAGRVGFEERVFRQPERSDRL